MGKPAATERRRLKSLSHSLTLDVVIGCEHEGDAHKIMAVLPKRFARFGLTMHPTKTALSAFRKPEAHQEADRGNGTCTFLGFDPRLDESAPGVLGDETQDSQQTAASHQEVALAMVPQQSSRAAAIPVSDALLEAPRAFPVLRYSGELPPAGGGAAFCGKGVAVLAESA